MSLKYSPPTSNQQWRFLASFSFRGSMEPGIEECVWRSYLDLSRTLHGFSKLPNSKTIRASAQHLVEQAMAKAIEQVETWTQESYDLWHKSKCEELRKAYAKNNFPSFTVGQAQKWINMSVKYLLTFHSIGVLEIRNAESLRAHAHVPIDDFIMVATQELNPPDVGPAWSRITDYDKYIAYQDWFRDEVEECCPLDAEFHLWLAEAKRRKARSDTSDSESTNLVR